MSGPRQRSSKTNPPAQAAQLIKHFAYNIKCSFVQVLLIKVLKHVNSKLGRTEMVRSASKESKAWAEAMLDPEQQVRTRFLILGNSNWIETYTIF